MKIDQEIDLPASIDRVWAFFDDVSRVAACMPGATLSEIVDGNTFDGNVAIKVGPIGVNYQGRLVIEDRDESTHTLRLKADGRDRKGAGSASAWIVATLTEPVAGATRLAVNSDVQLTGRMASLGRGVQDVAGKIFSEFGNRMSAEIAASETVPSTSAPTSAGSVSTVRHKAAPAGVGEPIKALPLLWSILRDKLVRLFRRRKVGK